MVGRELTKVHEELVIRPINELLEYFQRAKRRVHSCWCPPDEAFDSRAVVKAEIPDVEALAVEVGELTKSRGLRRRQALKEVGERHGLSANELYDLLGKR